MKFWLAVEIYKTFRLCQLALPEATSAWSVGVGMLSFGLAFGLSVSGASDFFMALSWGTGRSLPSLLDRPFGAAGWADFWQRWGTRAEVGQQGIALSVGWIRCTWFLLSVGLWAGFHSVMGVWLIVQSMFLMLDLWLGRSAFWQHRIPQGIKVVIVMLTFVLGLPLLYSEGLKVAWSQWQTLFLPPADNLYSLMLEARLSTSRVCWLLSLGGALMLSPSPEWFGNRSVRSRIGIKIVGGGLCGVGVIATLPLLPMIPDSFQEMGKHVLGRLYSDGNSEVYIGAQGWLYPQKELDRFVQRPTQVRQTETLLKLLPKLQAQGVHLLVLPVPDKIMLQPEFVLPASYRGPIYPPGYHAALHSLKEAGVDVLDLTSKLWRSRQRRPLHFRQDSHWRWEAMKEMVVLLVWHIREHYPQVIKDQTPLVDAFFIERRAIGDLAQSLRPSTPDSWWVPETTHLVSLSGLTDAESSPVVVCGEELIRVYDDSHLSFPPETSDSFAGFPIQLAALLGRAVLTADIDNLFRTSMPSFDGKLVICVIQAGDL